jgi:hypothetical protein
VTSGYGNLYNALKYNYPLSGYIEVIANAQPGYSIRLDSLRIGAFLPQDRTLNVFDYRLDGNAPNALSPTTISAYSPVTGFPTHTTVTVGSGFTEGVIALRVGSSNSSSIAIDNITYTVTPVPEPHEWAFMLSGLGLVGWFARRRQLEGAPAAA